MRSEAMEESRARRTRLRSGLDDFEAGEVAPEEAAVAREETTPAKLGMRRDQEIGDQTRALPALASITLPHLPREAGRGLVEGIELELRGRARLRRAVR